MYGINHRKVYPYWPKSRAGIERFYKNLGKTPQTIFVSAQNSKKELNIFFFQYRSIPHCTTNDTAAKLLTSREL